MNSSKIQPQPFQASPLNDYNATSSPNTAHLSNSNGNGNRINRDSPHANTISITSTNSNTNANKTKHNLPWILINGEFLLHKDESKTIFYMLERGFK
jgi:hypothetical protein